MTPIGNVQEIHSDNGGEYTGTEFQNVLLDNKIKFTSTAPYSPYQNGKAERNWRSLLEMSRCLLSDANLSKNLWTYAVPHAQYLRNRSYQRRTNKTSYELLTNHKPDMRLIYTFGAPCTYYNEGHKLKLDARGYEGIYLGINTTSQSYYVLKTNQQVVTSRNVTVNSTSPLAICEQEALMVPLSANQGKRTEPAGDGDLSSGPATRVSHPEQNDDAHITAEKQNETDGTSDIAVPEDKPTRECRPPRYLSDYYLTTTDYAYKVLMDIPNTYEEAIRSKDAECWKAAMDRELDSLNANETWEIKPLPSDRSETKGRWVYTLKQGKEKNQVEYKARYVAKGYSQTYGVDYFDTYSPTTRFSSIRSILQMATNSDLILHQLDVKGAYLNAPIDTDIYLEQPAGYLQTDERNTKLTCHLKKSIYGLKQSGRNWHQTLIEFLKTEGFQAVQNDPCVYKNRAADNELTYILFWVDDIIVASNTLTSINRTKQKLSQKFSMDDRGELRWFLGIDFSRLDNGNYSMSQERYVDSILKRFNMTECNPTQTPADKHVVLEKATEDEHNKVLKSNYPYRQVVGSLIYLMTATRPDISWIVSKLSQFLEKPGPQHVTAAKRVLRYLKATKNYSLTFKPTDNQLIGYTDSDWAGDTEDRKSTTGYVFTLGQSSAPISWKTQKQQTVALSSCEAEYMALAEAVKEMIYLRSFCSSLGIEQSNDNTIFSNNQGTLSLAKGDPVKHNRTKHIDIRYHFLREQSNIKYQYIPSCDNPADCMTKALAKPQFTSVVTRLGIAD